MDIEVVLHSTDPSAVDATRNTIRMLDRNADLVERDGRWFITNASGFVAFAVEHQGYVRAIVRSKESGDG
jgi:hypothetical protein